LLLMAIKLLYTIWSLLFRPKMREYGSDSESLLRGPLVVHEIS
jgi:hypothetical protein